MAKKSRYATKSSIESLELIDNILGNRLTFGSALKANRLAEEMTQEQLGRKAKVSRQYIHQLETGARNPSVEQAVRFSRIFGMLEDQFIVLALQAQLTDAGITKKWVSLKDIS